MNTITQIGFDFGTTNTVVALADAERNVTSARFNTKDIYRSILFFDNEETSQGSTLVSWAGDDAIREYLAAPGHGRLLQSLKSYLASPHFTHSNVLGTSFALENLIARFLGHVCKDGGLSFSEKTRLCVGRPVRFVGQGADADLALQRLQRAFHQAGMSELVFVEEPVAAAYAYAVSAAEPETVLIADLGGGTSDYSILRIVKPGPRPQLEILATGGIGVAGDDIDAAIMHHVVAPQLGCDVLLTNQQLPPRWLYDQLERWHYLSFLRTPANMRLLRDLTRSATDKAPFEIFYDLVEGNHGFGLTRAVQALKEKLSVRDRAELTFNFAQHSVTASVLQKDFEQWTAPVVAALQNALNETMATANVAPHQIDRVFMTGGTSYVPAVKAVFANLFGAHKIAAGNEFTSVATGLALAA